MTTISRNRSWARTRGYARGARASWGAVAAVRTVPVDRALVVRGAVGMLLPLAVGQLAGQPVLGAAAGLGAFGAAVDDSSAPWRTRVLLLALPQLGGAAGLVLGHCASGRPGVQVLLLALTALISGLVSTAGRVANTTTLLLLLATAMGTGLADAPWWQAPGFFLLGGLPLILWSAVSGLARAGADQREAVAAAMRAVAALADAGDLSDATATATTRERLRREVTLAMDAAYNTLLGRRLIRPAAGSQTACLALTLDALVAVIAALPAAQRRGEPLPAEYATRLRDTAGRLERYAEDVALVAPATAMPLPALPTDPALRDLHKAVVAAGQHLPGSGAPPVRLPAWTPPARRLACAAARRLRDRGAWAFALRLSACVAVGQAIAAFTGLPRSGWVVLTIALIVRPALGTVPARAATRAAGTLAGVLLGLLICAAVPTGWAHIAVLVALTGLLQAYSRRNYALQSFFLTPILLLLADPLGLYGAAVPQARLLDTLVGTGVALTVGYLLWPENNRVHVEQRLARVRTRSARYLAAVHSGTTDTPSLHSLRRQIHHDLAALHTELDRLRTDPRHHHALTRWRAHLAQAEAAMAHQRGPHHPHTVPPK
ncbi:FUSC family protein [Streptomyces sp. NPDC001941]|uniref:FUSC family protein n=1 Tax=Streptomyces sp. NPDC001941 TaxID=3154659 RepID=UPI00332199D9